MRSATQRRGLHVTPKWVAVRRRKSCSFLSVRVPVVCAFDLRRRNPPWRPRYYPWHRRLCYIGGTQGFRACPGVRPPARVPGGQEARPYTQGHRQVLDPRQLFAKYLRLRDLAGDLVNMPGRPKASFAVHRRATWVGRPELSAHLYRLLRWAAACAIRRDKAGSPGTRQALIPEPAALISITPSSLPPTADRTTNTLKAVVGVSTCHQKTL